MDRPRFEALQAQFEELRGALTAKLPTLVQARRTYFENPTNHNQDELNRIHAELDAVNAEIDRCMEAMEAAAGFASGAIEQLYAERERDRDRGLDQLPRRNLVADRVPTTSHAEDFGEALERFKKLLPNGWLEQEPVQESTLAPLTAPGSFLSLTKGLRQESEMPGLHRWRQALKVCSDLQNDVPLYDHFAGASLVPIIVQLDRKIDFLANVPNAQARIERLWHGASGSVDSTIFELLVAARCAERGRQVEFIMEDSSKSPDLRCHDPFPLVVECKRQSALNEYEIAEEQAVSKLFSRLRNDAAAKGIVGYFVAEFNVEIISVSVGEVVEDLLNTAKSRSAGPETYCWGTTSFVELPIRVDLPEPCRLFSPALLQYVFGWNSDLPEWDGMCCSYSNNHETVLDAVQRPIGLLWNCTAKAAVRKRTWAALNLFGDALSQVYAGEYGLVYIAHHEGARADIADLRLTALRSRLAEWSHVAAIRVPLTFVSRLHSRALDQGRADLIENTVQFVSELYGAPEFLEYFPSLIYTEEGE